MFHYSIYRTYSNITLEKKHIFFENFSKKCVFLYFIQLYQSFLKSTPFEKAAFMMHMKQKTLCKTVHQYNKELVTKEDMDKLIEIAEDYRIVKNYVFQRYGGIKSLNKIYPGYTIQKELTDSTFRKQLGLPSVYFNVAILDAMKAIKSQWARTKKKVLKRILNHPNFTDDEKHYLRFLLKVSNAFEMVLNDKEICLEPVLQEKYKMLSDGIDVKRLHSYLKRQVRKSHVIPIAKTTDGFSMTERAYRYGEHGIYITTKEKRRRVFVKLTDNNAYTRQLYIKLFPDAGDIELFIPVEMKCKAHRDYVNEIGLSVGMRTMLTTDKGHTYGEELGQYHALLAQWMRQKNTKEKNETNAGRKKYINVKNKRTEQLHSYINKEINRFIEIEKPKVIYVPKLPPTQKHYGRKDINYAVSTWQRGYIRKRLEQKCIQHSIDLVEVFGKDIGNVCSICNHLGKKEEDIFYCPVCDRHINLKVNAAENAKNRGMKSHEVDKS